MVGGLFNVSQSLKKTFVEGGAHHRFWLETISRTRVSPRSPRSIPRAFKSSFPFWPPGAWACPVSTRGCRFSYGLVNRPVAHKHKPVNRGRPGHEKHADFDDIWSQRATLADVPFWSEWATENAASVPGLSLCFMRYDAAVVAALRKGGGSAPDLDTDLRRFATSNDRARVVRALAFYPGFLEDDPRAKERLALLETRLSAISDFEGDLPTSAAVTGSFHLTKGAVPSGGSGDGRLTSEGGTGTFTWEGTARPGGVLRLSLGGAAAKGSVRVSSRLSWKLPDSRRVAVNLLVGGGDDCALVYVTVKVGGREGAKVCGRKDEVLRPAILEVDNPKGEPLTLEAVDKSNVVWGHLLLDDVQVLSLQGPAP